MTDEKKKPGRFSEERTRPDDQMAGAEGGDLDAPRFRESGPDDPREEVKKRASRYVMEDPEESGRRRHSQSEEPGGESPRERARGRRERTRARQEGGDDPGTEQGGEQGMGNESRPHDDEPITEERAFPDPEDAPGSDQEDEAWKRLDSDR